MLIEFVDRNRELDELEEVVENEINRLWKNGATLEEAAEAGARLAEQYWKEKKA